MFLLKKFLKKIEIINKKNKINFYENDSNFIFVTKLFFLLSNNDRKLFILIIVSSILGAVAEFASIGMVIPALKVVFSDSNYLFKFLQIDSSNIANQKYLSLLIICLGFIFSAFIKILSQRFSFLYADKISSNLFTNNYLAVLNKEITFHAKRNTSEWISIFIEGSSAINYALINIGIISASSLLFLFTSIVLFIFYREVTLIIFLFGIAFYFTFYKFISRKLRLNDLDIKNGLIKRLVFLTEGFGNIRQIKLYDQAHYFSQKIKTVDYKLRYSNSSNFFLGIAPKNLIEALAISIILFVSVFFFVDNLEEAIIKIGVFVFAANKIILGINAIYVGVSSIKSKKILSCSFLNYTERNYFYSNKLVKRGILNWNLIELKDVSFSYEKNGNDILHKVNLSINRGDRIGIVGKTGSGKSTLIDIIMGLIPPSSGKILVDGKDIYKSKSLLKSWRKSISHVPQEQFFSNDNLIQNLISSSPDKPINKKKIKEVIDLASIDFVENSFKSISEKSIGEQGSLLSGGQRQRISIARALYRSPLLLILDEATSSLDKRTTSKVIRNLFKLDNKLTIISITHDLNTLKNANRIFRVIDCNVIEDKNLK